MRYLWVRELLRREVLFRENPRFADWRPMYEVSRDKLALLLGVAPEVLDRLAAEVDAIHQDLVREAADTPSAGAMMQAPLLYLAVRVARPSWAVETGISSGYSARWVLEAMERNGMGRLTSVGLDKFALVRDPAPASTPMGRREIGWLVPGRLRPRLTIRTGRTGDVLPNLEEGSLDLFVHDSLHQYATMRFEYDWALERLAENGLLFSHDIHASSAWEETVTARELPSAVELDHDLGGARRSTGTSPRPGSG